MVTTAVAASAIFAFLGPVAVIGKNMPVREEIPGVPAEEQGGVDRRGARTARDASAYVGAQW